MNTAGSIASILGAMLLGGMGKGMFGQAQGGEADESTKKLASDPQILKFKAKETQDAEPIDVQAMMKKHAPGVPMTNDNINRVSASMPKDDPSTFQPISDAALMGDPMQQHMANYNSDDVGPEFDTRPKSFKDSLLEEASKPPPVKLPKRPLNVAGPKSLKEGYEQERLYDGAEEAPKQQGMIEKLISEIMKGKKPNPEEPYTNRGTR